MLTHIFQQSLDFGTVPTQWKHAYVTPELKKGSNQILKPTGLHISFTSVVCKCMEHIIVYQIMQHLEKTILTNSQFGFRAHHSCELQLFVTIK